MRIFFWLGLVSFPAMASALINGAGASFPFPLYAKWFSDYQKLHPDVQINYQSIGSGGGIRQFTQKTVDFGASDAPMTAEQMADAKQPILHIPTVLGAVVLTYNLPGFTGPLHLSGEVIAAVFQGSITRWNDPKIRNTNPKANLPDMPILVVHRADGSGTTAIFTDYLSKQNGIWKAGSGTAVKWPVGLGGKGNEGVAGLVKQTPGSLGYVELIYAKNNQLEYASVRNKAGSWVVPDLASVSAAASGVVVPEDFRVSITDPAGKSAYPIAGFTYLLVWKDQADVDKGKKLVDFLGWALKDGQKAAASLHYAPLPQGLVAKIQAKIATIAVKK